MPHRYKIYSELNFAVSVIEPGIISFDELYNIAFQFRKDKHFSEVHYQLTDLRGCSFDFDLSKLSEMKQLIEKFKSEDKQKLGVYIVDKPTETAYVHMFFKSLGLSRKYCSTTEKAFLLLKLPISLKEFKEKINI